MPTLYDLPSRNEKVLLRVIGDLHGRLDGWHFLANNANSSIQVGDFGIHYHDKLASLTPSLDPNYHKICLGNHDNYHSRPKPYDLGDYGTHIVPDFGRIFFVRGGYSIDYKVRTPGVDYFPEEELSNEILEAAYEAYIAEKPKFMISHECPLSIRDEIPFRRVANIGDIQTRTAYWLDKMYQAHKPKVHIFGHYHLLWQKVLKSTQFICLGELDFADFNVHDRDVIFGEEE